ncbi:MAG: flagellar hook protein FlgE [Thiomicrorhabdus chilensis]|uniref:flagellar hook protein FlgE n=1 Tax=Thiomicrorhabdus chilensis TaxID=63656 RepID=UPI00299D7233|nr:flagellar hook protein FlgE [Thiomicrorhabdus chilensis]MDX1346893.1 flagellar hook protein FlgE [Thiomicrorhabdus chilensis]
MGVSYDLNALSGINAASTGLGVISNNLANAQSVGFKGSRAEFADMFSGSQNSAGNGARVETITQDFGQGTINGTGRELDMAIDGEGFFVLDDKTDRYDNVYTRNGSFKLDKEGFLTDQEGNQVQGYLLNQALSTETSPVFDTTLSSIDLDELNKIPKATDEMNFDINLDGQAIHNVDPTGTVAGTDVTDDSVGAGDNLNRLLDPENNGTSVGQYEGFPDFSTKKTIHDSLGGEHTLNANFYKRDVVPDTVAASGEKYTSWIVQYTITDKEGNITGHLSDTAGNPIDPTTGLPIAAAGDPTAAGQLYELRFDTNGNYIGTYEPDLTAGITTLGVADAEDTVPTPAQELNFTAVAGSPTLNFIIDNPLTGATDPLGGELTGTPDNFQIEVDFEEMTQFAGSYNLRGVTQNGYAIGDLVGLNTGLDGVIEARYSNGRSVPVAQLAIANFSDKNAMQKLGGQTYAESFASGAVQLGTPQSSGMGAINAGSLEYSNVDVAAELVNMIQTQRTYQASAQVISTSQTLTQTILQL